MGICIHYRGTLDRSASVEALQDRVLDLALALGGKAKYWYSRGDGPKGRSVRGVLVDLAPGCDSVSLLFSEERRLVSLFGIEDAEQAPVPPDAWVFAKTQFAPVEAHVALATLLRFLKQSYVSDLEVEDDGGYWATGDLRALLERRGVVDAAVGAMKAGLRRYPLSAEASEDLDILAARVESIARLAQATLQRPPEHAPARLDADDLVLDDRQRGSEAFWDEAYRENARKVERLGEHVAREGPGSLEDALRAVGVSVDLPALGDEPDVEEGSDIEETEPAALDEPDLEPDVVGPALPGDLDPGSDPLVAETQRLLLSLGPWAADDSAPDRALEAGLCDALGGFAQAREDPDDPELPYGLRIAQLKRALRGLAFAAGSLLALHAEGQREINGVPLRRMHDELDALTDRALERLRELRQRLAG